MARKMRKRTRNLISGMLVGVASIFAVINFADIPADEINGFILSTLIFFVGIFLLALIAVSFFKLLGWLRKLLFAGVDEDVSHQDVKQDSSPSSPSDARDRE